MLKILILLISGLLVIFLTKKLILNLTTNKKYQFLIFITVISIFISAVFYIRESKLNEGNGVYTPPKYDGNQIIPGKVKNDEG